MLLHMEFEGLPPTVNHMYRMHGHYKYKTSDTRAYQEAITGQIREVWNGKAAYKGRVGLLIRFFTKNHKRWDVDNRVKALQDCLSMSGVIADDTQIDELSVSRIYILKGKDMTELTLLEVL